MQRHQSDLNVRLMIGLGGSPRQLRRDGQARAEMDDPPAAGMALSAHQAAQPFRADACFAEICARGTEKENERVSFLGKLIVFEGTDGSGKTTQFTLLAKRLQAMQIPFQTMDFPQYSEPSSALIRMYLGGEFGSRPSDVNAYAASTFLCRRPLCLLPKGLGRLLSKRRSDALKPLRDLKRRASGVQGRAGEARGIFCVAL